MSRTYRCSNFGCGATLPLYGIENLVASGTPLVCVAEGCGAEYVLLCPLCDEPIASDDFDELRDEQNVTLLPDSRKPLRFGSLGVVCRECQEQGLHIALSGEHHETWHDASACITCRAANGERIAHLLSPDIEGRIEEQVQDLLRKREGR